MDTICQELGINAQHVCETSVPGRFQLICDKRWLQVLEQQRRIDKFTVWPQLDKRAHPSGPLPHPWTRIVVQTYQKRPNAKVYPLPRHASTDTTPAAVDDCSANGLISIPMTYSQAVAYVTSTNFRNLWEASYKQFKAAHVKLSKPNETGKTLSPAGFNHLPYDVGLKELIQRIYNCPVIAGKSICRGDEQNEKGPIPGSASDCHANVLPAIAAVETSTHITVFFYPPAVVTSLYDCITYSSSVLGKSHNKPLFLIYQIFQLSKALQREGFFLGDIRLHDILVRDNLWAQVVPRIEANILLQQNADDGVASLASPSEGAGDGSAGLVDPDADDDDYDDDEAEIFASPKFDLKFAYDLEQFSLREYCEMWCMGQLSNYDYLTILNNAVGRSLTNPAYHHIMPWVTDFTSRSGANWRDLSKSKYRLNKGDVHLDLMFAHASQNALAASGGSGSEQNVPHHVTDFLSEITYFVYMARRTPQHILCDHVRRIWVPAEYPVSIQRLQEWTPDECIPEFYSDPMIFKSIHEDLPDLELPTWSSCPEDFVSKHREALESQYVSERLHHWIDLNFGYKLTGKAAIKAKNVCLSTVDQHKNICQRGIVQLFNQPHPPKRFASPWFGKTAPRLSQLANCSHQQRSNKSKSRLGFNESKRLAKSSENLPTSADSATETSNSSTSNSNSRALLCVGNDDDLPASASASFYPSTNFIELPKDYNPVFMLQSLESMQTFCSKTFPKQKPATNTHEKIIHSDLMFEENSEEHSFTNHLFADGQPGATATLSSHASKTKPRSFLAPHAGSLRKNALKQILAERRERELQVMGCLIVELFTMHRLRPLLMSGVNASFEQRLQACRTVVEMQKHEIPKSLRGMVRVLLQLDPQCLVSDLGLPPPSASQLLEPIFSNLLIPFPNIYYPSYALIRTLHAFEFDATLLELHTHFNCKGKDCSKYTDIDRQRVLFERKIAECKVMACCAHLGRLLEATAYEQFSAVELLLPHIIDLLRAEQTSILAAWNLFDLIAQALGITNTQKFLLQPIMRLYDVESFEPGTATTTTVRSRSVDSGNAGGQLRFSTSSSFKSRKSVKLYHHSFLLRLIVRFGLKCFLQNFITPLIEAVGGYKEPEDGNGFHYHSSTTAASRRTSKNLSNAVASEGENSLTLVSPEAMDSSGKDGSLSTEVTPHLKQEIEEVFSFDDDGNSDHISNRSVDSFDLRPSTAEEAQEDGLVAETSTEKLAISEIIYGSKISNNSFEEADKESLHGRDITSSSFLGPKSPTIDIPSSSIRRQFQLSAIDCEIGSRKSVDSFEVLTQALEANHEQEKSDQPPESTTSNHPTPTVEDDACDSLQASVISKLSEAKQAQNNRISEMSAESLVWLAHRLGPVLTSRYITRNLLRLLSLCYVGQENLLPETSGDESEAAENLNFFSVVDARVVGDRSAARVLECLMSIAALFGEEVILLQYFPHMSELIALSGKRLTGSLEGAIISSLQLLKCIVPCLKDVTIMEQIKDIVDSLLLPILRLLGSARILMPSGYLGRSVLARKLLDAIYALSVRIGPEMSKELLCVPILRPLFLIFDKSFGINEHFSGSEDSFPLGVSPPDPDQDSHQREIEEVRDVFGPALAHAAYLAFVRFLGEAIMQRTLLNLEFTLTLCQEFEQPNDNKSQVASLRQRSGRGSVDAVDAGLTAAAQRNAEDQSQFVLNNFGTQVVGNRLEVVNQTATASAAASESKQNIGPMEVLDMVAYKFEQIPTTRHLKGNWLAYWRHEISRADKDTSVNLKQIKLQSFIGHTNSIRALLPLDNENSFISASKDKTVKLWSLRSEGDGSKVSACQFTYTAHKKPVHSLAYLEALRYVVSCDGGVHLWDPFIGRPLGVLDSPKHNPVTVIKCLNSPSPLIVAGTAESSVKIIDSRCMQYVTDWRVTGSSQANATVRCLTVSPSGNWLAVGLSSGGITTLDTRTGVLLNSWRPMEYDLLQLAAPNDYQLVSSALDHSLAVWHANDGILHYQLKPPPEPAHFLQTIDSELVFATTGNRVGVYSDLRSSHAMHSVTKLRSETFRGVLTSLAVLPLNHIMLAGNESGHISLLC